MFVDLLWPNDIRHDQHPRPRVPLVIPMSFRVTGFLIVIYLLGLAAAGWYFSKDYRETSRLVLHDRAAMIARQVHDELLQAGSSRVLAREPGALQKFRQIIHSMVRDADQITGLAVFDRSGELLAGQSWEGYSGTSRQIALSPQSGTGKRFSLFSAGRHDILMPLRRQGQLIAHLGIQLDNQIIGSLYHQLSRRLIILALAGTVVLLLFGGYMYRQLRRTGIDLVKLMQPTSPPSGKRQYAGDEFHHARIQASKTGSETLQHYHTLSTLSRTANVGLLLFGKDASEVFVSDSAREVLDINYGKPLVDGFGDDNWQTIKNTLHSLTTSPHNATVVEMEVNSGNTTKQLEIEFYRTRDSNGHILALIRDRNHVTALQSSLRAATRMHTLSSIYLSAAHDLRAPISAMVLNLELLEDSLEDSASHGISRTNERDQRRYIRILKEELNRLQRFLTSFLNNATTVRQSGWQSVNLASIVLELLRLFHSKARQSRVEIVTDIEDTKISIMADGDQIRQMLMNIIVNALEAMPGGGVLSVSIHRQEARVVIRIRDTGTGIPPSVVDHVFDMHFTTRHTGTGIGLNVAQSVVQQHGGNIKVNNALDLGAELVITLPAGQHKSI